MHLHARRACIYHGSTHCMILEPKSDSICRPVRKCRTAYHFQYCGLSNSTTNLSISQDAIQLPCSIQHQKITKSPSASPKKCNPEVDIAVHLCAGDGESAEGLHSLFRTAWEAQPGTPVPLFGSGQNIIPTIHVADLAAYVAAVCIEPPAQQYLLAVDDAQLTQRDVVAAVAQQMGGTPVKELGLEELYFQQVMQLLAGQFVWPDPCLPCWIS